ncbi:hypothetical protein ACGC1H_001818 [Rhizoctonia solani]
MIPKHTLRSRHQGAATDGGLNKNAPSPTVTPRIGGKRREIPFRAGGKAAMRGQKLVLLDGGPKDGGRPKRLTGANQITTTGHLRHIPPQRLKSGVSSLPPPRARPHTISHERRTRCYRQFVTRADISIPPYHL